jgi:hypothetical protein
MDGCGCARLLTSWGGDPEKDRRWNILRDFRSLDSFAQTVARGLQLKPRIWFSRSPALNFRDSDFGVVNFAQFQEGEYYGSDSTRLPATGEK